MGGSYYLEPRAVTRAAPYTIELHRVALATGRQDPAALDHEGSMFAWLEDDTLSVAGNGPGQALWLKGASTTADSPFERTLLSVLQAQQNGFVEATLLPHRCG